jgi:hypothetical protein
MLTHTETQAWIKKMLRITGGKTTNTITDQIFREKLGNQKSAQKRKKLLKWLWLCNRMDTTRIHTDIEIKVEGNRYMEK